MTFTKVGSKTRFNEYLETMEEMKYTDFQVMGLSVSWNLVWNQEENFSSPLIL